MPFCLYQPRAVLIIFPQRSVSTAIIIAFGGIGGIFATTALVPFQTHYSWAHSVLVIDNRIFPGMPPFFTFFACLLTLSPDTLMVFGPRLVASS
jgi:hypothetical protein